MTKPKICYPVIVEGKYDRQRILDIFDAQVITTDGFGIFRREEKAALLRTLASSAPIIVLTDSDGAGKLIRSRISQILPRDKMIQLYTPRIEGKERRKAQPSAEGVLGVEGMERQLVFDLLSPYTGERAPQNGRKVTKADLYADGLSGGRNSSEKRDMLASFIGLPPNMTPNALLAALEIVCPYEKYREIMDKIQTDEG